jgi:uncharacterized membrane protein YhaH (DUF805 family)
MSFTQAIASGFLHYAKFAGRASRSELWFWLLFSSLAGIVPELFDRAIDPSNGILSALWGFAVIVPTLAVAVRRLHDTDRNGWWLLLFFIPFFGGLVLIVWFCLGGKRGYNRFGANPLPAPPGPRHRVRAVRQ